MYIYDMCATGHISAHTDTYKHINTYTYAYTNTYTHIRAPLDTYEHT